MKNLIKSNRWIRGSKTHPVGLVLVDAVLDGTVVCAGKANMTNFLPCRSAEATADLGRLCRRTERAEMGRESPGGDADSCGDSWRWKGVIASQQGGLQIQVHLKDRQRKCTVYINLDVTPVHGALVHNRLHRPRFHELTFPFIITHFLSISVAGNMCGKLFACCTC